MSHWRPPLVRKREDYVVGVHLLPFSENFKRERERLHPTIKDDVPNNIYVVDVKFMTRHQLDKYVDKMPHPDERISQLTLDASQGYFKIFILICMCVM